MGKIGSKLTSLSDKELVQLALGKNQGAFASLLGRYRESLTSYVMNYVSVIEDAEDICQRTFEKAFMNIDRFNSQYAFSTWLFSIAQNEAIDHLRRSRNALNSVPITNENDIQDLAQVDSSPEDKFIVDQAVNQLITLIGSLPASYAKVAEMRFIKDYAYEDIATILDLPIGTVKTRINRARKMLVKLLDNQGNERDN